MGGAFFGTATMEKFSEVLAKKDSDLAALQGQLSSMTTVKRLFLCCDLWWQQRERENVCVCGCVCSTDELEEEVVRLTTENASLQQQTSKLRETSKAVEEMQQRAAAAERQLSAAQMRLEELELDAEDMRQSYRLQLDQLAQENERLRSKATTTA